MRLFIALPLSEAVREALRHAAGELRAGSAGGTFTRPENMHLTLAFIGETDRVQALREVIDTAAAGAFPLAVSGAGRFGDLWWAGVEHEPALTALAERLNKALRAAGFPVDSRPFRPHITLARRVELHGAEPRLSVPRVVMTADWLSLMRSERVEGRLTYTELYGRRLGS